ncbi:MAG: ABC transporter ATP-binding protein [Cyanobacteria bacterium DS2.3.42]|nr:ABC transporter ATP-binding protein [Cyanobacteria bacterium DS2.3.42]
MSAKSEVKQSTGAVIQVDGLVKRYKDGTEALKNLVLEVQPGELFGLVGPDGAGKSTALKILAGIMEPTSGKALVLNSKPRDARRFIGYVAQGGALYPELSVDENLRYEAGMHGVGNRDYAKLRETYLGDMGLLEFSDRLAGQLSGGMKQKLALCCALVSKPKVIFLDEPTTGLDPISRRELWQALAVLGQEGVTTVVATPFLDEAERCHRVALMYDGAVHEIGKPSELKNALGLSRLEIAVRNDAQTIRALSELNFEQSDNIVDICPFGDHIEVLCKDVNRGREEVGIALANANIEVSGIEESAPNLENVFITTLKTLTKKEVRHIPFPHLKEKSENNNVSGVALKADKLNMVFGKFKAVDNVDLELRYGEIFGLLGANGAGKTTTIKMLCRLLKPTSGSVTILGDSSEERSREIRKRIGYMSQKFTLYDNLTVKENLEFYAGIYEIPLELRKRQIDWVIDACDLSEIKTSLVKNLPLGWKQRIAFGAAVMHDPEVIFLDEPTAGVDPLARRQMWKLIRAFAANGAVILVTTHYLDEAEFCNRMAFMASSQIVAQGSPQELKAMPEGELFEIKSDDTQTAFQILSEAIDHWRVSIFGSNLHVILDNLKDLENVKSILTSGGIKIESARPIAFSLEDAFIDVVQHKGRRHSAKQVSEKTLEDKQGE